MHYREMFPSKYLEVQDIDQGRKTTVTISAVKPIAASTQPTPQGFGDVHAGADDEPEILWAMYFREYRKPIRFKPYHAKAVFAALGEADPSKWIGRQVLIYAGTKSYGDIEYPKVLISPEMVMGNALPPAAPRTAGPSLDTRGIGIKAADNFRAALAEQNAKADEYLEWLKSLPGMADQNIYEATFGKELSAWPCGGIEHMRKFLKDYQTIVAPPATFRPPAAPQPPQELPDEDIPF